MHLTFDALIEINNITIGSNNIILRKVNVKPHGFDKMYMNKKSIEDKLYQKIDQFNERKIATSKFYSKKFIYFMMEMVECVIYPLLMMIQWIKIYGQI